MWITPEKTTIDNDGPYVSQNGTSYPYNFPKSEIPELLPIIDVARPETTLYQTALRDGVELVEGSWIQKWRVTNWTQEQIDNFKFAEQSIKWEQIKAERDRRKFGGVKVGTNWIHSDTFSRTQWLGMVLAGDNLPQIPWSTLDGGTVTTTPTLAMQVFQAVMAQDASLFATALQKKSTMQSLDNPASFDHLTGWPLGLGE